MENSQIQQAGLLLTQATKIIPVGARQFWSRTLPKAIVSIAISLGYAALSLGGSVLSAHQILDQGVISSVAGASHAFKDIQPSPAASVYDDTFVHPLLKVGMDEDGFINKDRLLAAWHHAGIKENQAEALVVYLWGAGSVITSGVGVPEEIADHRFHTELLSKMDLPDPSSLSYDPSMQAPDWPQVEDRYNLTLHSMGFGDLEENFAATAVGVSPEEAKQHLASVVQSAGFASYSVPINAMSSAQAMYGHADALLELASNLADVTGWEGQVAGLGGRVHFINAPDGKFAATTRMAGDGILIKGSAQSYPHEFIHAVDYVVVQKAYRGNSNLPLSDDKGLFRIPEDRQLSRMHHQHLDDLREAMPRFHGKVDAFRDLSTLSFLPAEAALTGTLAITNPSEIIARSFEMHVAYNHDPDAHGFASQSAHNNNKAASYYRMDYMYPSPQEAVQQSAAWSSWFKEIARLNLSKPYEPPIAEVQAQENPTGFACALASRRLPAPLVPMKGCTNK